MPDRDLADAMLEVVRERMEGEQLSVNAMAKRLGTPQPTLFQRFRGVGTVSIDDWAALADALGMTLEDLIAAGRRRV